MRWKIEGADAGTGSEIRLTVEAATRDEAEAKARYNGILVANVSAMVPEPAPPLAYEAQPVQPAMADPMAAQDEDDLESTELRELAEVARAIAPQRPLSYRTPEANLQVLPGYQDIVTGAQWLNVLSAIIAVTAWLCIVGGCVFFVLTMSQKNDLIFTMVPAVAAIAIGGGLIVAAALVRMAASLAMAVRDIARNSFQNRSESVLE